MRGTGRECPLWVSGLVRVHADGHPVAMQGRVGNQCSGYSARSAVMGSARDARTAGTRLAPSATIIIAALTPP